MVEATQHKPSKATHVWVIHRRACRAVGGVAAHACFGGAGRPTDTARLTLTLTLTLALTLTLTLRGQMRTAARTSCSGEVRALASCAAAAAAAAFDAPDGAKARTNAPTRAKISLKITCHREASSASWAGARGAGQWGWRVG